MTVIATRVLTISRSGCDIEVPVRIYAPRDEGNSWSCRCEVDWPDGTWAIAAGGADAVQALAIALQLIGAQLYGSDHHASGELLWLEAGNGYGFPVPNSIRNLLIGDDKKFM